MKNKSLVNRLFALVTFLMTGANLIAQIPSGYYNNAQGKTGTELRAALHNIIKGHTSISYGAIWDAYWSTDNKGDGVVWDMYSDNPGGAPLYTFYLGSDECGTYSSEGDCYNREHSWCQSWFNDQSTPRTDLHHIFPTDGYVNNRRSNFPFGEVKNAKWTSRNGSKLGPCRTPGYSGTVFEPIDAYKGDFARALMYMSVRYFNEDSGWKTSGMTNKSDILPWAIDMLLRWNELDPVSQKEIDRNNAIYDDYQHNRNPFIDHPEYARMIWDENGQGGGGTQPEQPSTDAQYHLVTSTDMLVPGRTYVIASADTYSKALGKNQTNNNRTGESIEISGNTLTITDAVCELRLGRENGKWTFYDANENGYLYAASSSKNQLRTQSTNDANGQWNISIGSNHTATIVAQGSNTHNTIRYNVNNGSPIFSCYTGGQQDVYLYVRSENYRVSNDTVMDNLYLFDFDQCTVSNDATLIVNGTTYTSSQAQITLTEGAQLIQCSNGVTIAMEKNIEAYITENGGWQLIASPLTEAKMINDVEGLSTEPYDLFALGSDDWIEKKNTDETVANGEGYLFAHGDDQAPIRFVGTANACSQSITKSLYYNIEAPEKSYSLVGNPFTCNATVDKDYFSIVEEEGICSFTEKSSSHPVPPCTSILVKASTAGDTVTFTPISSRQK